MPPTGWMSSAFDAVLYSSVIFLFYTKAVQITTFELAVKPMRSVVLKVCVIPAVDGEVSHGEFV